jgi:hypothetical protein
MRERIGLLAGERQWSDTRDAWLARAARACGLRYARVRAIWYGEVDRFWWDEVQAVEEAANKRFQEMKEIGARNAAIRLAVTGRDDMRANQQLARRAGDEVDAARVPHPGAALDQEHAAVRSGDGRSESLVRPLSAGND